MKILKIFLLILFISFSANSQCNKINQQDLTCIESEYDDYVSLKIDSINNVEILYKIDYCELLTSKKALQKIVPKDFYVLINGKTIPISVEKNYYNLIPISVRKIKKLRFLYVVEFNLISNIGLNGFSYLYLDLDNINSITTKEFDFKNRLTTNEILNKL